MEINEINGADKKSVTEGLPFLLYACAKATQTVYADELADCGLTFTQYLVMSELWRKEMLTLKELGKNLHLDSGTLSPLCQKLGNNGLVERRRCKPDERNLRLSLTAKGKALREKAGEAAERAGTAFQGFRPELSPIFDELGRLLKDLEE